MTLTSLHPRRFLFPAWMVGLLLLIVAGLISAAIVFTRGLIVTNMNNVVPWGLWISIDLSSIGLSAGAFMLSAAVYILGLKHLRHVARTAVFIGLIGYSMAVCTLLLDIGRPDRFWHAVAYWNIHSPLWEVTMCVTFYLMVLSLEVIPTVGRSDLFKTRWPRLSGRMTALHKAAPVLAVVGLGLSLLHQSSLGATYGVLVARPIWYRPGLAVLFIVSAMAAGLSFTVLASKASAAITPRARVDHEVLDIVSRFVGWILLAYLYLRFWDALSMSYTYEPGRTEALAFLTKGPLAFNFWAGEIILGIVVPMIILLIPRLRREPRLHLLALILVVGGLIAYRWDTNMAGQLVVLGYSAQETVPLYTQYTPSLIEIVAGAGVIAIGLLVFTLGVRYFNVVDHEIVAPAESPTTARGFSTLVQTGAGD